jgi:hypothetical protein
VRERAVVADRLALALADAQPADELGADQQADEQAVAVAAPARKVM